jgi:hypothetical protein
MQSSKYVINLIDLQNINTSVTGESSTQQLQDMVQYATKTVSADFLCIFTTGANINVLSDMTTSNLTVAGTLTASTFISSNSNIFVSGDLGASSVYDTLYNPPVVAVSGSNTGGAVFSLGPFVAGSSNGSNFTVSRSGIYQIQTRLRVGGSAATINTAGYINGFLYDVTGSSNVPFSQQTISGSGIVRPDPSTGVIEYEYITNANLTANSTYRYTVLTRNGAGGAGTWNLGTSSLLDVRLFRLS